MVLIGFDSGKNAGLLHTPSGKRYFPHVVLRLRRAGSVYLGSPSRGTSGRPIWKFPSDDRTFTGESEGCD